MPEIIVNGQTVDNAIASTPGVTARLNSGATTVKRARLNFITGPDISIGVVDDGADDEIEVTISASVTSFPGFYGGATAQDAGAGSPGLSGLASRGDHSHPVSSAYLASTYRMRSRGNPVSGSGNLSLAPTDSGAFTPRLALHLGGITGDPSFSTHIGFATSTSDEGCWGSVGTGDNVTTSHFISNVILLGSNTWNMSTFNSTNVQANRSAGAGTYTGIWFIVGDA